VDRHVCTRVELDQSGQWIRVDSGIDCGREWTSEFDRGLKWTMAHEKWTDVDQGLE